MLGPDWCGEAIYSNSKVVTIKSQGRRYKPAREMVLDEIRAHPGNETHHPCPQTGVVGGVVDKKIKIKTDKLSL